MVPGSGLLRKVLTGCKRLIMLYLSRDRDRVHPGPGVGTGTEMNDWDKSPEQEQALITRCLRGEKDAWEDFVRSYTRLVYFIINKLDQARAARLSREEIADLHNDVFLLLMEKKLSHY